MADPRTGLTAEQVYAAPPCAGEGCRWLEDGCGLARLGVHHDSPAGRLCAARIVVDAWIEDDEFPL